MSTQIASNIIFDIIKICTLISKNEFEKLDENQNFDPRTSAAWVKTGILEYLCGDILNDSDLKRIGIPDENYIINNSKVHEVHPDKSPEEIKIVYIDLMIDGKKSDLTLILYIRGQDKEAKTQIYGARTL
jgi:hypothetical protein